MKSYREILDPNNTLPVVRLDTTSSHDYGHLLYEDMTIISENTPVGRLSLASEEDAHSLFAHFDGIEVVQNQRGRGVGLATYILAIELSHTRGFNFESQNSLTEHSKKVWEHLGNSGVAQIIVPLTDSPYRKGEYNGKFRVPLQ